MQESQKEPSPAVPPKMSFKTRLSLLIKVLREGKYIWRARLEGPQAEHAEETLNNHIRSLGATEEGIGFYKAFIGAWRKARRDDEAFHTVDRYLVGGIGIFDLVLFQVLVSVGHPDLASSLAWVVFVVSLPCTVASLLSSFLKKANGITTYGRVHSTISGFCEFLTLVSATALICHIWLAAGLVFFGVTVIVALLCYGYVTLVFLGKHLKVTKPVESTDKQVAEISAETRPADAKLVQDDESGAGNSL